MFVVNACVYMLELNIPMMLMIMMIKQEFEIEFLEIYER